MDLHLDLVFAVLVLPGDVDERAVVTAAAASGVALEGVGRPGRAALAVGYANLPEASAPAAVAALAEAIGLARSSPNRPPT